MYENQELKQLSAALRELADDLDKAAESKSPTQVLSIMLEVGKTIACMESLSK